MTLRLAAWGSLAFIGLGDSALVQTRQSTDCVRFSSNGRLPIGTVFRLQLPRGLEFLLADDDGAWELVVRPLADRGLNLLDVTPPVQTRPHVYIGPRYLSARESVGFARDVRFVVTREDFEAARGAITAFRRGDAPTVDKLDALMKGRLFLNIEDHNLKATPERDRDTESLEWIVFSGEVCLPAS